MLANENVNSNFCQSVALNMGTVPTTILAKRKRSSENAVRLLSKRCLLTLNHWQDPPISPSLGANKQADNDVPVSKRIVSCQLQST
jgi:hypothetical protein